MYGNLKFWKRPVSRRGGGHLGFLSTNPKAQNVLTESEAASLLARRPYDLRHAGVSFWLSSEVDAMECARSAGHIIAALRRVYAKVLDQTRERANSRIEAALREWNEPE